MNRDRLVNFLHESGYTSVRIVEERGDFSLRGAIIDIYTPFYEEPLRLEFDGDRLESIRRFETETQRSITHDVMKNAILLPARDISKDLSDQPLATLFDYLNGNGTVIIDEADAVQREAEAFTHLIKGHYEKALAKKGYCPSAGLYLSETPTISSFPWSNSKGSLFKKGRLPLPNASMCSRSRWRAMQISKGR